MISNFQSHENWKQFFFDTKPSLFGFFKKTEANFQIELRGLGVADYTSRHQGIIKVGKNFTFHMVLSVASRSQFLAGLMAKQSIVGETDRYFK